MQASGSSGNRERSLYLGTEQERPSHRASEYTPDHSPIRDRQHGNRQERSSSPFRSRKGEIKESSRRPAQVGSRRRRGQGHQFQKRSQREELRRWCFGPEGLNQPQLVCSKVRGSWYHAVYLDAERRSST